MSTAIIDTSALISFYYLGYIEYLNLIFSEIKVPRAVEAEFLQKPDKVIDITDRHKVLESLYSNCKWFNRCGNYYDEYIDLYSSYNKLDDGELEVFAQNQFFNCTCVLIIDENAARKIAKDIDSVQIEVIGTLRILAKLDFRFNKLEYFETVEKLLGKEREARFSRKVIEKVWEIETQ